MKEYSKAISSSWDWIKKNPKTLLLLLGFDLLFILLYGFVRSAYLDKMDQFFQAMGSVAVQNRGFNVNSPSFLSLFVNPDTYGFLITFFILFLLYGITLYVLFSVLFGITTSVTFRKKSLSLSWLVIAIPLLLLLLVKASAFAKIATIIFLFCLIMFLVIYFAIKIEKEDIIKDIMFYSKANLLWITIYGIINALFFIFYAISTAQQSVGLKGFNTLLIESIVIIILGYIVLTSYLTKKIKPSLKSFNVHFLIYLVLVIVFYLLVLLLPHIMKLSDWLGLLYLLILIAYLSFARLVFSSLQKTTRSKK